MAAIWIVVSARNNDAQYGVWLRHSPFRSAGWHFVPIFNLWKPYQAFRQLRKAAEHPTDWLIRPTPRLLNSWWALWLLVILFRLLSLIAVQSGTVSGTKLALQIGLVAIIFDIACAVLFGKLVRDIAAFQNGTERSTPKAIE